MEMHNWFGIPFAGTWVVMIIGALLKLAFYGVVIYFIIKLINNSGGKNSPAIELLKQRYAKGEINKEEYEEKLRILKK